MIALSTTLSTLLLRLWPERRHQERLLDLGERKGWTDEDRDAAVGQLADWLIDELHLPSAGAVAGGQGPLSLPDVPLDGVEPVLGVGLRTVALARLVGTEPKTLANTLRMPLRSDRRDHRWLLFLSRLELAAVDGDALVFHRRSPASVTAALHRGVEPDAGDALLLMSLVTLWQRRRPTPAARATRGKAVSRRSVPKPAAAMKWDVVQLSQLPVLIDLALNRGGVYGQTLAAVVLDAALTEAHLAPHLSRRLPRGADPVGRPDGAWGGAWLRVIRAQLAAPELVRLLGDQEAAVFRWRVDRMEAYATGSRMPVAPALAHPYVDLGAAIDQARAGLPGHERVSPTRPGYLMLLPQARRLGLIEDA